MRKPRIGIFDFACCEGCQLQIVNLEEEILDLLGVVTPVEWREAMSDQAEKGESFDIALVEGSITREEDAERLREIRARAKFLIALGACATIGGVNKLKNNFYRVTLTYGYQDRQDIPLALARAGEQGLEIDMDDTTFFLGRETLLATREKGMALWREKLFAVMSKNAERATTFFRIPPARVIEIGTQIEL